MIATVPSATLFGVEGRPVSVEVHIAPNGLPAFSIVGQPDSVCREARDRVRAAMTSSGLPWPNRKITVNLAPSGVRKGGAGLDLAIGVALLAAAGEVPLDAVAGSAFLGELGLDGAIRRVPGIVPLVDAIDADCLALPASCHREAALIARHQLRPVSTLRELVDALRGDAPWPDPIVGPILPDEPSHPDLADVRGQPLGRWAVEVAAAGGHHLLLIGPPGAGKTMLARRLPGLLPLLDTDDALDATRVHSAAGLPLPATGLIRRPPFRAPHHSASIPSLIGGGTSLMRPGEISLAHRGVLFMDEMGEFPAVVLDNLRQPLEEGVIRVSRAKASVAFPARFLLIGATNPCPCGQGGPPGACRCSDAARLRYARRLSGPLLDRFDLRVAVERPDVEQFLRSGPGESTSAVAERVAGARALARQRGVATNAELPGNTLDETAPLEPAAAAFLERRLRAGTLTARGLHRLRRVARTVADLDGAPPLVGEGHVRTALELRADLFPLEAMAS